MKYDFFLSYACIDDEPADPNDTKGSRWVSNFHAILKTALTRKLHREPRIFFDGKDLSGNSALTPEIEAALAGSSLFVGISTTTYYTRPWCAMERKSFLSRLGPNPAASGRLFVIHTTDMNAEDNALPGGRTWQDEFCPDLRGYYLFRTDKVLGRETLLGWPALLKTDDSYMEYFQEIGKLADDMAEQILRMEKAQAPQPGAAAEGAREIVYLAETASESYADREELRVFLTKENYEVRPAGIGRKPEPAYRAAVAEAMKDALAFVQVIGPAPQELPKSAASCDEIQRGMAGELPQFRWRPAGLVVDEALFPEHKKFAVGPDVREQLLPSFKDDLAAELKRLTLNRRMKQQSGGDERVVLISGIPEDLNPHRDTISARLKQHSLSVFFTDAPAEEIDAEDVRGLLVLYGAASDVWVKDRTIFLRKLPATRLDRLKVGVFFCPPPPEVGSRHLIYEKPSFRKILWSDAAALDQFASEISK